MKRGIILAICVVLSLSANAWAQVSDYDIYMWKLVNRARIDPAGELARLQADYTAFGLSAPQFSTVTAPVTSVATAAMQPLAFHPALLRSAERHNGWMMENVPNHTFTTSGSIPSHSHFETLNDTAGGTTVNSPHFTGAGLGARLTSAITFAGGPSFTAWGENIQVAASTAPGPLVSEGLLRTFVSHLEWWESTGHRNNILNSTFDSFGYFDEVQNHPGGAQNLNPIFDEL